MAGKDDDVEADYAERNGRRKHSINQLQTISHEVTLPGSQRSVYSGSQFTTPTTAGYSLNNGEPPPYFRDMGDDSKETSQDPEVTNETAAALFQSPINGPGDALHLLLEASGRSEDINRQQNRLQSSQSRSLREKGVGVTQNVSNSQTTYDGLVPGIQVQPANIDPAIITGNVPVSDTDTTDYQEAVKAWSRLRFVRAGWLTATEAMSYID